MLKVFNPVCVRKLISRRTEVLFGHTPFGPNLLGTLHGVKASSGLNVGPPVSWNLYSRRHLSSERLTAQYEEEVLAELRKIAVDESKNLVSSGLIRDLIVEPLSGRVRFTCLSNDAWVEEQCISSLSSLQWIKETPVIQRKSPATSAASQTSSQGNVSGNKMIQTEKAKPSGMSNVKNVIAVSSCKGGVGKSTVSVNLAVSLQQKGYKVGILDADVYGPSLPTMMVGPDTDWKVTTTPDKMMANPVNLYGIACMSYGFVAPGTGGTREKDEAINTATNREDLSSNRGMEAKAAILRGPMVSSIVEHLTTRTAWGELDYLIVDMPPGTGDIHLTLCQQMENKIDAAVIVTTPQRLSFVDVVKGVDMFNRLKVPTVAVVENMSYFKGDSGKKYFPFGNGYRKELTQMYGIKHSYTLPISASTSSAGDSGIPFMVSTEGTKEQLEDRETELVSTYYSLADVVVKETETIKLDKDSRFNIHYSAESGKIIVRFIDKTDASQYEINPLDFRKNLSNTSDMLGMNPEDIPEDVHPLKIQLKGNYAVGIDWSDGYDASIYSKEDIRKLCENL